MTDACALAVAIRRSLTTIATANGIDAKTAIVEAQVTKALGEANAQTIELANQAKADRYVRSVRALGGTEAYNRYLFAEGLPAVLVSAGGGAVGERLLRTAIAARPLTRFASARWLLVGGQNLPADVLAGLGALVPEGCALARYRSDLASLMGQCAVSVSQAGYNTVVEGLAVGARMVLVPFAAAGEDERR